MDVIIRLEQVGEERDGARFNVVFEKTRGFYGKRRRRADGTSVWTTSESGHSEDFATFLEMLKDKISIEKAAKDLKIHRATAYRWKAGVLPDGRS